MGPPVAIVQTAKHAVLTEAQYRTACKLALIDFGEGPFSIYSWGHCGPAYYLGRIVVVLDTLGR